MRTSCALPQNHCCYTLVWSRGCSLGEQKARSEAGVQGRPRSQTLEGIMDTTRVCTKCNTESPISEFSKSKPHRGGHRNICRVCTNAYQRERNKRPLVKERMRKRMQRWRKEHPGYFAAVEKRRRERDPESHYAAKKLSEGRYVEKRRARSNANYALRKGKIVRASSCADCGVAGALEMHHEDYTQQLVVLWLCRGCHQKRHRLPDGVFND